MSSNTPYDREHGIQAIIALQKCVGISEPRHAPEHEWDGLSEHDKIQTTLAHQAICGGQFPEEQ